MSASTAGAEARRFGRSAGMLSAGVGAAGVLTYAYFALASHNLDADLCGGIARRIELRFAAAALGLALSLAALYRRPAAAGALRPGSADELGARLATADEAS